MKDNKEEECGSAAAHQSRMDFLLSRVVDIRAKMSRLSVTSSFYGLIFPTFSPTLHFQSFSLHIFRVGSCGSFYGNRSHTSSVSPCKSCLIQLWQLRSVAYTSTIPPYILRHFPIELAGCFQAFPTQVIFTKAHSRKSRWSKIIPTENFVLDKFTFSFTNILPIFRDNQIPQTFFKRAAWAAESLSHYILRLLLTLFLTHGQVLYPFDALLSNAGNDKNSLQRALLCLPNSF